MTAWVQLTADNTLHVSRFLPDHHRWGVRKVQLYDIAISINIINTEWRIQSFLDENVCPWQHNNIKKTKNKCEAQDITASIVFSSSVA